MTTAVVVGAGPNGLTAAVVLARAGVRVTVVEAADTIGGGTRSGEATLPGLIHDHCSAVHPFGPGSPYLSTLDLERHGLHWEWPEIDYAHPLDDGDAGLAFPSLEQTSAALGDDGHRWRRLLAPATRDFDTLAAEFMRPIAHVPRHLVPLASFGPRAVAPATLTARLFRTERARSLFMGVAAHAYTRLDRPATSAVGLMLAAGGHRHGWPVARGGSAAITTALASMLAEYGGTIVTGTEITTAADIPVADTVVLDVSPETALRIYGDLLPARVTRAYRGFRRAPGAYKVDFAVEGPVPWRHPDVARAGTVHIGGTAAEIAAGERDLTRGRMPERPFMIVGQQYVADPTRSRDGIHPLYAYAHVPNGHTGDETQTVIDQIERFAPGFSDRVVAQSVTTPAQFASWNGNYGGGDIIGGSNGGLQVVLRPRPALDPYSTGIPGVYLCSASTPPGAGAHGMCGHNAAQSALRRLEGVGQRSAREARS